MLRLTLLLLIGTLAAISGSKIPLPTTRDIQPRDDGYAYRLPNSTKPEAYTIDLTTNVHNAVFNFVGTVNIDIVVVEPTPVITIHHRQLTISFITLESIPSTGETIQLAAHSYDPVTEFLSIPLQTGTLTVGGRYRLQIIYTGTLRTDEAGFYRSSYIADDGSTRSIHLFRNSVFTIITMNRFFFYFVIDGSQLPNLR